MITTQLCRSSIKLPKKKRNNDKGGDFFIMSGIGTTEIIIIAAILLLFFGGKKIPEFIRGLGEAVKEFKKSSKEEDQE